MSFDLKDSSALSTGVTDGSQFFGASSEEAPQPSAILATALWDYLHGKIVASGLAGKLAIASNLSDLNNATTARNNLGLGSLATQSGTFSGTASGINTGDQTIALTGDVTGSGAGSFAATVAANAITNAKAAQMASNTIKGNNTGATANASDLTAAQVRGVLALPTSTVAGRVALYTDTAGSQGQSSAIFESAGNVGIGTTSPVDRLQIAGTMRMVHSTWAGPSTYVYADAAAPTITGFRARGTPSVPMTVLAGDSLNSIAGFGYTGSAFQQAADISFLAGSDFNTSINGIIRFGTVNAGTWGERMRISANGNVGIGTTSPRVRLDVAGPVAVGSYTVATVPSAAIGAGQIIYVTNESGGATLAFSDGTNWRRTSDNAILS